jgi:hypothetical protein
MAVAGYRYRIDGGTPVDAGMPTLVSGRRQIITGGMTSYSLHDVEVQAYDVALNYGPWSPTVSGRTLLPPAVVDINPSTWTYPDGTVINSFTDDAGVAWEFVGAGPTFKIVGGIGVLRFDGSTTGLKTSSTLNLSAATKVDVFCKQRTITYPGGANIIYEHGTDLSASPPALFAFTGASGGINVGHNVVGGANYKTTVESFVTAKVLHCKSDVGLTGAAETTVKVDGVLDNTGGVATENTGNFGNKTLYVGARTGTSLYSNFDLYRLRISVGGLTSGQETGIVNALNDSSVVRTKILVCIGDSLLTTNFGTTSVPIELSTLLGPRWTVINESIGGQLASQVDTNFATQATVHLGGSETVKVVLNQSGINDLNAHIASSTVIGYLQSVNTKAIAAGAICLTNGHTGIGPDHPTVTLNADRQTLDALIRANPTSVGTFVDLVTLAPALDNGDGPSTYFLSDDIHWTTAGRVLVAQTIYDNVLAGL